MADTAPLPSLSNSPLSLLRGATAPKPSGLDRWKNSRRFSRGEMERESDGDVVGSLGGSPTKAADTSPKIGELPPPTTPHPKAAAEAEASQTPPQRGSIAKQPKSLGSLKSVRPSLKKTKPNFR